MYLCVLQIYPWNSCLFCLSIAHYHPLKLSSVDAVYPGYSQLVPISFSDYFHTEFQDTNLTVYIYFFRWTIYVFWRYLTVKSKFKGRNSKLETISNSLLQNLQFKVSYIDFKCLREVWNLSFHIKKWINSHMDHSTKPRSSYEPRQEKW